MKIAFDKLETNKSYVEVKADKYKSAFYDVDTAKTNGIELNPKVFKSLDDLRLNGVFSKPSFTEEIKEEYAKLLKSLDFMSSSELGEYLASLSDNTVGNPYKISLKDLTSDVRTAMIANPEKYVEIILSDTVTSIDVSHFSECLSLTSITIPSSVTSIGPSAFFRCRNLTSVISPDSVTSIGNNAFYACSSLTSVTIPDSVTEIRGNGFGSCIKLKTINYNGTKKQWDAISKDLEWNFNVHSECVINYNYQG